VITYGPSSRTGMSTSGDTTAPEGLTACSWVLHGTPTVTQLVNKFPAFYWAQKLTTVFTGACNWSLSRVTWAQFMLFHHIS
jgi:hypothetical protein